MEWLSFLLIEPLSTLYQGLYELIQIFVPNLGTALLGLSVATVLLMMPLEKCVRSVVEREKLLESILTPQVKAIKAKFQGAEQHAALKRLYYRYRYSPLYSIRATFGVLIQLPFLMGAYWMLSNYAPLRGDSYGILKDLSEPDGLLFGGNLLPVLMTVINVATVWLSRLTKRDAVQAVVIALLFLVLLYDAPSALLLYWTTNNVLHFLRAGLKRVELPHWTVSDLLTGVVAGVGRIVEKAGMPTAFFTVLLMLGVLLRLLGVLTHKAGWMTAVYFDAALMMTVLAVPLMKQLASSFVGIRDLGQEILKRAATLLVLAVSFYAIAKIIGYGVFELPKRHLGRYSVTAVLLELIWLHREVVFSYVRRIGNHFFGSQALAKNADGTSLMTLSLAMLFVVSLIVLPLRFYVQNFKGLWFTGTSLLAYVLMAAAAAVFVLWVIRRTAISLGAAAVALMLTTAVVIQSFLWPQQVKEFIGNSYDWLHAPLTWCNLVIWGVLLSVGSWFCIRKKTVRRIALLFNGLVILAVSGNTLWQAYDMTVFAADRTYDSVAFDKKNEFGLGKENIIVILLDTLSQETMEAMNQSDHEEFQELFRGFTWYTNNLGSGPLTSYAIPYIFTGEHIRKGEEYPHYINRAYAHDTAVDAAIEAGFRVRVYSHGEMFPAYMAEKIDNAIPTRLWGYARINKPAVRAMRSVVAYGVLPDILRSRLKMNSEMFDKDKPSFTSSFSPYWENDPQFYDDFRRSPFVVNRDNKEFVFYHLSGAHPPYRKDINGKWIPWGLPDTTQHEQVLGCLRQVGYMFDRLRAIGKFKDSTIVVMSDHGKHFQVKTSYPILFVKKAGEDGDKSLVVSDMPTGHKDVLTSVIRTGVPENLQERVVIDGDSNLWKAPAVLTRRAEDFTSVQQVASTGDRFTTDGFDLAEFWGRRLFAEGTVHFANAEEEWLKLIFDIPAKECNGYVNFEEKGKNKRIYVGRHWGRVLYKRTSQTLKITPECEKKDYITNAAKFRTFNMPRRQYGLFDVLSREDLVKEFYRPELNQTVRFSGRGPYENMLISGFSGPEGFGRWIDGIAARLAFIRSSDKGTFDLKVSSFLYGEPKDQRLVIRNDAGKLIQEVALKGGTWVSLKIEDFAVDLEGIPLVKVSFETPDAQSPESLGLNKDRRILGVALKEMVVRSR